MAIWATDTGVLTWPASEVPERLGSAPSGLAADAVARRLDEVGPNSLPDPEDRSPWTLLLSQFRGPLTLLLAVAMAVSIYLSEVADAVAIGAILILNAAIGFYQEWKGERAVRSLRNLAVPAARVRREGKVIDVSSRSLVPGDIVLLEAGAKVPADCRLIRSEGLRTQEAALTGEAASVEKSSSPLPHNDFVVADQSNMVFLGTHVIHGRGEAVVVQTGPRTQLGEVARMLHGLESEATPLQKRLGQLGQRLGLAALGLVGVVVGLGWMQGTAFRELILTALSLAVAAVPEGLPAVATVALTLGARRMLRRKALIRRLPAVETMGSVTVICSDKTGTLTENRMELSHFAVARGGSIAQDGEPVETLALAQTLCTDVHGEPGEYLGDPTEVALVEASERWGYSLAYWADRMPRVGEIPFSSERRRMTTVHRGEETRAFGDVSRVALTKGAFDSVKEICRTQWDFETGAAPFAEKQWEAAHERLAQTGMRVLALSFKPVATDEGADQWETRQHFLGLVALWDPPREEARAAVAQCREAGIRPLMITGDHPLTARHIAKVLGFDEKVLAGSSLSSLSESALEETLKETSVFARVSPGDKLRIVKALQKMGHVVAMTGDGVNDGPALKRADIGVAMGKVGTDVAKEASEVVLLDDNFATLVHAVEEGRVLYDNIRKFVRYILSGNLGEVGVMLAGPVVGLPLPLLPLQILWVNLVTDGLPALALSSEKPESRAMTRPPVDPEEGIFARGVGADILWIGTLLTLVCIGGALYWVDQGREAPYWRTGVFTLLSLSQMGNVLALRRDRGWGWFGFWRNPLLMGAVGVTMLLQAAAIYHPFGQYLLGTTALSPSDLGLCAGLGLVPGLSIELKKAVRRRTLFS